MALAQISLNSVAVNPAKINPQVKTDQSATTAIASRTADQALQRARTDTITISRRAAQMSAQVNASPERTRDGQTGKTQKKLDIKA